LIKIHGDNASNPKWTYDEFDEKIYEISDITSSTPYNNK